MKSNVLTILAAIFCAVIGQTVLAQITINIPAIPTFPKIRKEKPETAKQLPTTTESSRKKNVADAAQDDHPGLVYELKKIEEMRVAVDKYAADWPYWPESKGRLNYILFAVSKSERENYLKGLERDLQAEQHRLRLNAALDVLAASAAKKLPAYKPRPQTFAVRNPAGEKLILQKLKERLGPAGTLTIYKSGFQSNWQIYKDSIGLPQYRFMRGYVYAKRAGDDHPYCHLYYVSISQNYAGGGTYGSSYATFEDDLVFGCP